MAEPIRGWRALAKQAGRDQSTCREWVRNGCPHTKDDGVHLFDWDQVQEWLHSRQHFAGISDDAATAEGAGQLALAHKRELFEKTREEKIKLRYQNELAASTLVHREQAQAQVAVLFSKIKRTNRRWLREMLDLIPDVTAEEQARFERELVDLFNSIAEIKI